MHSSRTTTTGAITRASTISPRPTSTSGAVQPSYWKEKESNARPSKTVGCFTTNKPRNINHDAPDSLLVQTACCLKISDDGHVRHPLSTNETFSPDRSLGDGLKNSMRSWQATQPSQPASS